MSFKNRIIQISAKKNLFLFGIRGSGKTRLLKRLFPSALYIDLLDKSLYQSFLSNIGLFYEKVNAFKEDGLVVVDEIQKMPELLDEVHRLIESSHRRFILTGSSARKINAKKVNLLGGRAGKTQLHPFVPEELGEDFSLDEALRYGLIPVVWSDSDRGDKLKDYIETYLEEEIRAESLVRDLPAFSRFLQVAGLCHGQVVNMSNIAIDAEIKRYDVGKFFSILEETLLGFFIPAYFSGLKVKEKKSPKFYLTDPGLARGVKKNFGPVAVEEKGTLFEGLTAQILRAYKSYHSLCEEIYYWSPLEAKITEVDFILKRGNELIAIEAKAKEQVSAKDYKGLKAVKNLPAVKRRILVYMGKTIRKTEEGIEIQPFDFFCKNLKEVFQAEPSYKRLKPAPRPLPVFPSFTDPTHPSSESEKKWEEYKGLDWGKKIENKTMSFKPSKFQIPPPADENLFEDLCLDLYKAEFGDKVQKNGSRGQPQKGVDIVAPDQRIGIQCKKRDLKGKITEKELKEEVKKAKQFKTALRRFILAATCQRDAKIQEIAREISKKHEREKLFSVEIHSWDEIKSLFDKYPEVYEKHYPHSAPASLDMKVIQSDSPHQELNKIRDLLNKNKPKTAFDLLEKLKQEKWGRLKDNEKYRLLTNKACALIAMREEKKASALLIEALQFNRDDEDANTNCAMAYLILGDLKNSKKFIEKAKSLNLLNAIAHVIEIQIKDKEGQDLGAIVSSLPKAIRENHQTALILSHISGKRKRYAEAKKWLDVFEQQRPMKAKKRRDIFERQDLRDMARYADISLRLILAKPDIFSGRCVPENLKKELKKIINIYQKLNTDSQYSELRQFQANWPLQYALALELNGELDEAVFALQTGIKNFPEDDHLKIELSRLFAQKGDSEKSIALLEKQLGLSSSASGDSSDSINKKPSASNQINISRKPFYLTLILTDLYFYNRQNNKAWNLLEKIIEDSFVNEADRLEAQRYKVFRLISFDKINEAEKQIEPLFEKNQNDIFTLILKSKIENYWKKTKARKGNKNQAEKHRLEKIKYLKKAYNVFKDKKYEEQISQNNPYFESKEHLKDIQQLSKEFYHSEMYPEAESLLEEITNQNLNHPEIFKLLHSYFKNGKNRQAIDLAENLLKKFPDRPEPATILFQLYQELGNIKKSAQYYAHFIQANPDHAQLIPIKLDLIHTYINSEQMEKARELLKEEFDINSLSPDLTNYLSMAYAKTGNAKKALKIQYQGIKKHPGKMELENMYFSLFILLDKPKLSDFEKAGSFKAEGRGPEDTSFLHLEKAGLDCYVQIKDIKSSEEQDIIIEKNTEVYTPEHELSKALLGKKAGDKILFTGKTYQIMEVKSKYVHKYEEIVKKSELQYGSKTFLRSAHISKKPDIKELKETLRQFTPDISKWQENLKQLFQAYRERKVTVGFIAKTTGRHPIEIMEHLIFSKKDQWISAFQGFECYDKAQDHLENSSSLLLDLFSLVMIHQIKMEESLKNSKFDLYVCQSTIDSLKDFGNKTALHSKDGLLTTGFDEKGELRKNFVPAKIIKQDLNFWIKVKIWAEEICRIKPLSSDFVLKREERRKWEQMIGKEFLDPLLALYNDRNIVFLSEDAALRDSLRAVHQEIDNFQERGKKSSQPSVRLFDLIGYLKRKAVIDSKEETQFKAGLIKLNQTYVPIDHNILLLLLKEAEYSISDILFQRGLFFLGPVSDLSGAIHVTANFFIELCQEPSLLPYRRQMIINEVLNRISFGRKEKANQTAHQLIQLVQFKTHLLPLLQNELYGYIIEWRKGEMY